MAEFFIKKIWQDKTDESVHKQFVRFGKGNFPNRAVINLRKGSNIKLGGSFELANDFTEFVSELAEISFSGIIQSREEIEEILMNNDADFDESEKKKLHVYIIEHAPSRVIKEIKDKAYAMLLDAKSSGISLKIKKKLPKPGKSGGGKVDDKFCVLELDLKYWQQVKEAFMLPECKKCKVKHTYIIDEIIPPKNEKDFEEIRLKAKRKGKIIRELEIDGKTEIQEHKFEV